MYIYYNYYVMVFYLLSYFYFNYALFIDNFLIIALILMPYKYAIEPNV